TAWDGERVEPVQAVRKTSRAARHHVAPSRGSRPPGAIMFRAPSRAGAASPDAMVLRRALSISTWPQSASVSVVEGQRDFRLDEATIAELGSMLDEGIVSARSLAEAYLERIEQLDGSLASVVEVNPEALDIADTMDPERRGGRVRGPLHGIPVMVKDNIATADRMRTTAGSLAMRDARPSRHAAVVHRLREAGAVLLAKTNLSEWANFRSELSSSGWSAVGGQCHNPHVLDRNPCGSSSGSAVVVAANLCAAAIGTETDGSIVCPSSIVGIVGIKPTPGLGEVGGIGA